MDVAGSDSPEARQFRREILKTLGTLPIPNRTMLIDSKVLSVIEKWAKQLYSNSPSGDSPEDDQQQQQQAKSKFAGGEEVETERGEKVAGEIVNDGGVKKEEELVLKNEIKTELVEQTVIAELAANLLVDWSNLKEVFRIPKKERIEQMKEHEREAGWNALFARLWLCRFFHRARPLERYLSSRRRE